MATGEVVCAERRFPHRGFDVACGEHRAELVWHYLARSWNAVIDGTEYQIRKEGLVRMRWTMWRGSASVMSARGRQTFRYPYELDLETPAGPLGLERVPFIFVSGVDLYRGQAVLARIAPPHMFSFRINVTLYTDVPFELLCFAICLSAEMRRIG